MKGLIRSWLPSLLILSALAVSCKIDDFSDDLGSNVAPTLAILSPGDTTNVNEGFVIKLDVRDATPGLSLASITLFDGSGVSILTISEKLIGVADTVEFNITPNQLPVGGYSLKAMVQDTDGIRSESTSEFYGRPYKSIQNQMFVLGSMNGWGANDPDLGMTLVDDYTWEIQDVTILVADQFKFVNTSDFSDTDWSDSGCDGVADEVGGPNLNCGFNGIFTIRYNDLTFEYSLEGEALFLSNQDQMFVLGSLNGWGANDPDLGMALVDNNTWEVSGVTLTASDEFKFANTPDFSGTDWSDTGCDGIADEVGAGNLACGFEGKFTIRFNDETFEYSLISDFLSNQDQMYVLGSMNGWGSNDPDLAMNLIADFTWEVSGVAITASDQFKFANTPDFSGVDWTDAECDGLADEPGGANNINCGFDGTVKITYNDDTFEYSVAN